jgi:restriction system protein
MTERGRQALDGSPVRIDMHFLERYPEYRNFRDRSSNRADSQSRPDSEQDQTPDERLETSYRTLRQTLAQDLLERIKQAPPAFFEQVVVDLLIAMGYGCSRQDAGQAVGKSGDGGIDGIIKEDKLGLDFVYVQAKRWDETVGRPLVKSFAGSLEGRRARKGVFIPTWAFTGEAQHYVTQIEKRIVLVDGEQLAQLMIDHGVGVADVATYHVKRIDSDYFDGE